jgi:hypothetical protein
MSASGTPIMKYLSVGAGGTGTISFGQEIGYVYVRSIGPDTVFMAVGGTPPTPSAGDGRVEVLETQPIEMDQISLSQLSFACAALKSAVVEAIGYPVMANS